MTDIAATTSLIACGLIVIGCAIALAWQGFGDFLRSRREWREHRERWMRLLLK